MENLTGVWEGEYSYNHGTENEPDLEYFTFRLHIVENDGVLSGICEDTEPQFGKATITGFVEGDFISFIKKYEMPSPDDDDDDSDEQQQYHQVHYSGNYHDEDSAFEGTWEITVSAERVGYQEEFILENLSGTWCISKK